MGRRPGEALTQPNPTPPHHPKSPHLDPLPNLDPPPPNQPTQRVGPATSRYTKGLTADQHKRHSPGRVMTSTNTLQGQEPVYIRKRGTMNIGGSTGTVA